MANSSLVSLSYLIITCRRYADGKVEHGALGGTAEKVGGPFDKEGTIGKQFTTEGGIGGKVQDTLGGTKEKKM